MKKALVLTGGGCRGAFQVGALLHILRDRGEKFDIITGTSVGALNGSFLAQFKKEDFKEAVEELHKLWLGVENKTIKKHWKPFFYLHALWKQSLFNSEPLEKLIDKNLDREKIMASGVILSVLAVSLDTGVAERFREDDPNIKDAVKASSAFPVFFKPVRINGQSYVDGGVREVAPLNEAISLGADHITIINTGPLDALHTLGKKLKTFGVALRSVDLQGFEVINNDLARFIETNEKLKNKTLESNFKRIIDYTYIGPDSELTDDPLDFDPDKIREMILKGYNKTKEVYSDMDD